MKGILKNGGKINAIFAVGFIVIVASGTFLAWQRRLDNQATMGQGNTLTTSPTPTPGSTLDPYAYVAPTPKTGVSPTPIASLGLFKDTAVENGAVYYNGGTITEGAYAGKMRIVAVYPIEGPTIPGIVYFVETNPGQYVSAIYTALQLDGNVDFSSKVTGSSTEIFGSQPNVIDLDGTNVLYAADYSLDYVDTSSADAAYYKVKMIFDQKAHEKLSLKSDKLTFYANKATIYAETETEKALREKYLAETNHVWAVDANQIAIGYVLTTKTAVATYEKELATYMGMSSKETAIYPTKPGFKIDTTSLTVPTYSDYHENIQVACSLLNEQQVLTGITDADLVSVGNSGANIVYILKDTNHPIYRLLYDQKKRFMNEDGTILTSSDTEPYSVIFPSFGVYMQKNPILIEKDFFGRYLAFAEGYYMAEGGCGKPVVYLYPTKDTAVNIRFTRPMELTTQIPQYDTKSGWNVLAHPNGQLTDLQANKTNCALLPKHVGSEYAADACATQTYPYIYWAGFSTQPYPEARKGFVVAATDLEQTIRAKLSYIGLSQAEQDDMVAYWVPALQAKRAPYYRLTFFQNREMDALAPMQVTPKPDSTIRVFLDWSALTNPIAIQEQTLTPMQRTGFTLVEWGGLKK